MSPLASASSLDDTSTPGRRPALRLRRRRVRSRLPRHLPQQVALFVARIKGSLLRILDLAQPLRLDERLSLNFVSNCAAETGAGGILFAEEARLQSRQCGEGFRFLQPPPTQTPQCATPLAACPGRRYKPCFYNAILAKFYPVTRFELPPMPKHCTVMDGAKALPDPTCVLPPAERTLHYTSGPELPLCSPSSLSETCIFALNHTPAVQQPGCRHQRARCCCWGAFVADGEGHRASQGHPRRLAP